MAKKKKHWNKERLDKQPKIPKEFRNPYKPGAEPIWEIYYGEKRIGDIDINNLDLTEDEKIEFEILDMMTEEELALERAETDRKYREARAKREKAFQERLRQQKGE